MLLISSEARREQSFISFEVRRHRSSDERQQSSGERAAEFWRSGEMCQTVTIGAHDEVVDSLFICVSVGLLAKF
jgi:hypothetical protein